MAATFQPFDTQIQMMEYDSPFPATAQDSWTHDDAAMEDDLPSHYNFSEQYSISSNPVEVDMDFDQEHENPEYDMLDGEQEDVQFTEENDLVDVEVYDASPSVRASPFIEPHPEPLALSETSQSHPVPPPENAEPLQASLPLTSPAVIEQSTTFLDPARSSAEYASPQEQPRVYEQLAAPALAPVALPEDDASELSPSVVIETGSGEEGTVLSYTVGHLVEAPAILSVSEVSSIPAPEDRTEEPQLEQELPKVLASQDLPPEDATEPVNAENPAEPESDTTGHVVAPSADAEAEVYVTSGHEPVYGEVGEGDMVQPPDAEGQELLVHVHAEGDQTSHDHTAEDNTRPEAEVLVVESHEVSEAVFIEPPPGVLLSILSASAPEFTLFGLPSSYPAGPSSSTLNHENLSVLFQDKPSLYYEPFSKLLSAIREEQFLRENSAFSEGELVLNFIDLQLSISEDNKYADDSIGLHEMSILHEGLGLSGPLCCRLENTQPRFISRYQSLLAHLTDPVQEEDHQEHYDQHTEMTHEEHHEEETESSMSHDEANAHDDTEHVEELAQDEDIGSLHNHGVTENVQQDQGHDTPVDPQAQFIQEQAVAEAQGEAEFPADEAQDPNEDDPSDPLLSQGFAQDVESTEETTVEPTADTDNAPAELTPQPEIAEETPVQLDSVEHNEADAEYDVPDPHTEYEDAALLQDDEEDLSEENDFEYQTNDANQPGHEAADETLELMENEDLLDEEDLSEHEDTVEGTEPTVLDATRDTDNSEALINPEAQVADAQDAASTILNSDVQDAEPTSTEANGLDPELDLENFEDSTHDFTNVDAAQPSDALGDWELHDGADSMNSSVTISSTKSSKRPFEEALAQDDIDDVDFGIPSDESPGFKRARIS